MLNTSMFLWIDYWIRGAKQFKLGLYWKWQMQVNEAIFLNLRYSVFALKECDISHVSPPPEYKECIAVNVQETNRLQEKGYGLVWNIKGMASEELFNILHDFGFDRLPTPFKDESGTLMAHVQRMEDGKITCTMQVRFSGK